jgi:protein Mpv17
MTGAKAALLGALAWQREQLRSRPYATNCVTSAVLMWAGDRTAQRLERDGRAARGEAQLTTRESYTRSGILTSWSSISANFWTWWYRLLPTVLPGRPFAWVLVTAITCGPTMNGLFFTYSTAMEHIASHAAQSDRRRQAGQEVPRLHLDDLYAKVEHKLTHALVPTVLRSSMLWIPFNYVNFSFVPLEYRVLTGGAVSLFWNAYLSVVQHAHAHAPATAAVGGAGNVSEDREGRLGDVAAAAAGAGLGLLLATPPAAGHVVPVLASPPHGIEEKDGAQNAASAAMATASSATASTARQRSAASSDCGRGATSQSVGPECGPMAVAPGVAEAGALTGNTGPVSATGIASADGPQWRAWATAMPGQLRGLVARWYGGGGTP